MSSGEVVVQDRRIRVALFATHPIQYHIPWFQRLAVVPELDFKVFFGLLPDAVQQGVGFDVGFQWDIPLLDGYRWELLPNVAKTPSLGTFGGCDTPEVGWVLRDWRPDVAILTGWQSRMLTQAWWACVRLDIPRIVRGESNHLAPRSGWKRFRHRMWLKGFDRFLAIGQANRTFYREAGIPAERIHDCLYFIDNQRFAAAAAKLHSHRAELRRGWGIPTDVVCFLFSGKLIPKKHPLDLLHALSQAIRSGVRAHVLMAGSGELLESARALVEREQLPVTFAGFLNQSEIVRAYVAADCLVLPSDTGETWGLVVNEAMACGLPAIVSDQVGCGPDLILQGETGALFPMGDVPALAAQLMEFAIDPVRLSMLGARARRRVLADYSVEQAVVGTLAAVCAVARSEEREMRNAGLLSDRWR
ncbi:MAG TPA: glycosyltransferase family 4 protein [Candidatus Competibacter sp.]|nr:glycosyltransferase family 4 protein [Candidatus Competibacter sp.]